MSHSTHCPSYLGKFLRVSEPTHWGPIGFYSNYVYCRFWLVQFLLGSPKSSAFQGELSVFLALSHACKSARLQWLLNTSFYFSSWSRVGLDTNKGCALYDGDDSTSENKFSVPFCIPHRLWLCAIRQLSFTVTL